MWKIKGAFCISQYKGIMVLDRETINAELLLTKLVHQQFLSFAV